MKRALLSVSLTLSHIPTEWTDRAMLSHTHTSHAYPSLQEGLPEQC